MSLHAREQASPLHWGISTFLNMPHPLPSHTPSSIPLFKEQASLSPQGNRQFQPLNGGCRRRLFWPLHPRPWMLLTDPVVHSRSCCFLCSEIQQSPWLWCGELTQVLQLGWSKVGRKLRDLSGAFCSPILDGLACFRNTLSSQEFNFPEEVECIEDV